MNNPQDFDPYHPDNIPLFEVLYGKNLISLGGLPAIDNMFSDITIRGLKALDVGFGLGGVAFYLSEKYKLSVSGIELYPWMVQYAKDHAPRHQLNSLDFHTYDNDGNFPFKPETFDLVYSKGVLNHVADKIILFEKIKAVLKPNGLFVIADWIFPQTISDTSGALVCETRESYEQALLGAGFSEINFRDDSDLFLGYAHNIQKNLVDNHELIQHKYGEELFHIIQKQNFELIDKIKKHAKIAIRIVATTK